MGMRVVLLLLLLVDMMEIHHTMISRYSILFMDCLRFECGRSLAARSLAVPREVCTPMTPNNVETRNERKQ